MGGRQAQPATHPGQPRRVISMHRPRRKGNTDPANRPDGAVAGWIGAVGAWRAVSLRSPGCIGLVSLPSGWPPPHQTCTRSRIDPQAPEILFGARKLTDFLTTSRTPLGKQGLVRSLWPTAWSALTGRQQAATRPQRTPQRSKNPWETSRHEPQVSSTHDFTDQ